MPYYAMPCQADHGLTTIVQDESGLSVAKELDQVTATLIATALNKQAEHMARADAFAGMLTALELVRMSAGWVVLAGQTRSLIESAIAAATAEDIPQPAPGYDAILSALRDLSSYAGGSDSELGHPCRVAAEVLAKIDAGTPPAVENAAPAEDFAASEWELNKAREVWADDDCRVESDAEASRGNDGTWVQAWVLIPNEDDGEEG